MNKSNNKIDKGLIHLGIAFDQNYLAPFYALITSIFENNQQRQIVIHAIITGVSEEEKLKITNYAANHNCKVIFYTIDEALTSRFVLTGKWTAAVYYRLFFPLLVSADVERLLYLDTDTLVINDLGELFNSDLGDYPVGAVYDNWVKTSPQLEIFVEGDYFNSGVLLIDVPKWNLQRISEKTIEFLNNFPEKIKFVDQDALNGILKDNWKKLDIRFNFMYSLIPEGISKKELDRLIKDKVVIHFTLQRPWFLLCKNRLRDLYFNFLQKSPGRYRKSVIDFEMNKMPALLKLRAVEFYNDSPGLQKLWRKFKR